MIVADITLYNIIFKIMMKKSMCGLGKRSKLVRKKKKNNIFTKKRQEMQILKDRK